MMDATQPMMRTHIAPVVTDGVEPVRLQVLLDAASDVTLLQGDSGQWVTNLRSDSRAVVGGSVFVGLAGGARNGADFAAAAVQQGAVALLLAEAEARSLSVPAGVALIAAKNPRLALAQMSAVLYAPQPEFVVAVTGTDGKTSTTDFARQLLDLAGLKAASLGTIGARSTSLNVTLDATHTTPDPITLHQQLRTLAQAGAQAVAMEASSHGLDQFRMDGVRLAAAAFTNLGRDHLDYHHTEEEYYQAKRRLLAELLPAGGVASICADDARSADLLALCRARGHVVVDYGRAGEALKLLEATPIPEGLRLVLAVQGKQLPPLVLPLMGSFQALNALAAVGLAHGCGVPLLQAVGYVPLLRGVRGRMECVATTKTGASVIVDYAHTPRALETVLQALRPHTQAKLRVVFGCGGDRDRGKRPLMGAVAAQLADAVIVTDDNPRSEDPAAIRAEVMAGCPDAQNVGDRAAAIAAALAQLGAGDVLLIAGKGHETTQTIGAQVLPFDDAAVVRDWLATEGN